MRTYDTSVDELVELQASVESTRRQEVRRGLLQVMGTAPSTVARVAPADGDDGLGRIASVLNRLDRRAVDVVYVDRWSAAVQLGRGVVEQ